MKGLWIIVVSEGDDRLFGQRCTGGCRGREADMEVIEGAGGVLNACHVMTEGPACYFKKPKLKQGGGSLWDFAATWAHYLQHRVPILWELHKVHHSAEVMTPITSGR